MELVIPRNFMCWYSLIEMIMYRVIGIITLFLILFSCSNREDRVKKVTRISSVSELSDTLFFAKVKNMISKEGDIFFIDKYRNRIVCMDVDGWKLKTFIGTSGEGPDELCNLSQFTLKNDTLYALDGGCGKLVAYDLQGNICTKYPLPLESRLMIGYHFLLSDGNKMDISTSADAGAFAHLDLSDGDVSFFGERYRFEYTSQDKLRNGRYLLETADGYVAVSDNMPQIEKYDRQKNRVEVYDYSDIPMVKRTLLQWERKVQDSNSYGIICEDACIYEDKLYLLLVSDNGNGMAMNRIAVFSLFPQIKWDELLEMPGRMYSTFCVSHERIIAFESQRNCFEAFSLWH